MLPCFKVFTFPFIFACYFIFYLNIQITSEVETLFAFIVPCVANIPIRVEWNQAARKMGGGGEQKGWRRGVGGGEIPPPNPLCPPCCSRLTLCTARITLTPFFPRPECGPSCGPITLLPNLIIILIYSKILGIVWSMNCTISFNSIYAFRYVQASSLGHETPLKICCNLKRNSGILCHYSHHTVPQVQVLLGRYFSTNTCTYRNWSIGKFTEFFDKNLLKKVNIWYHVCRGAYKIIPTNINYHENWSKTVSITVQTQKNLIWIGIWHVNCVATNHMQDLAGWSVTMVTQCIVLVPRFVIHLPKMGFEFFSSKEFIVVCTDLFLQEENFTDLLEEARD